MLKLESSSRPYHSVLVKAPVPLIFISEQIWTLSLNQQLQTQMSELLSKAALCSSQPTAFFKGNQKLFLLQSRFGARMSIGNTISCLCWQVLLLNHFLQEPNFEEEIKFKAFLRDHLFFLCAYPECYTVCHIKKKKKEKKSLISWRWIGRCSRAPRWEQQEQVTTRAFLGSCFLKLWGCWAVAGGASATEGPPSSGSGLPWRKRRFWAARQVSGYRVALSPNGWS